MTKNKSMVVGFDYFDDLNTLKNIYEAEINYLNFMLNEKELEFSEKMNFTHSLHHLNEALNKINEIIYS